MTTSGRIRSRLQTAFRDGGAYGVLREIHKGGLFRLYEWVLDRDLLYAEPALINTATELGDMTVQSENREYGAEYVATPYSVLFWILDSLKIEFKKWSFIDVGSGRGRVVFAASRKPFKSVIGVEYAKELHDDAVMFIEAAAEADQACGNIALLNADATTFDIPDGPCIFFLFNPFDGEVVEVFLEHALASFAANPRPMKFAYFNPLFAEPFERRAELAMRRKTLGERMKFSLLSPYGYQLYEVNPA